MDLIIQFENVLTIEIGLRLSVNLEAYGKVHPYVFLQVCLREGKQKVYSF